MTSQQLHCFICVADKLNFTKAAEELFLSPPTVTHHIKSLEEELETKLFIRTSKMVTLTEAGSVFYNDAKEIYGKMNYAKTRVAKASARNIHLLRIGCTSSAELAQLSSVLPKLRGKYPHLYPQIIIQDYFHLKSLFENQHLDLMLVTKEMVKDIKNCVFRKVADVQIYVILSTDSSLSRQKELTFEEISDGSIISLHPKFIPFQYGNTLQGKITQHFQQHFDMMCENDQSAILLAQSGYGTAILPRFCIPQDIAQVKVTPLKEQDSMEYGIAYQSTARDKGTRYFIELFAAL